MKVLQRESLATAKILVRVPNWIGDAVMCLPALRELRRILPEAELVVVARPWVGDLLPTRELRCRLISYDTRGPQGGLRGRWRLACELRKEGFAAAILFQNAFDAALLAWLSQIPIRAGYNRQGRGLFLTHAAAVPQRGQIPAHEAHYYLELLRRLGLMEQYSEVREIRLPTSESGRATSRRRLQEILAKMLNGSAEGKPLVGISPGATYGTAKRWPAERFAQLAQRLSAELGAACVFFGSAQEKALVESLLPEAGKAAISLAGQTTLADFIQLVQGCDLYLTNDTGTMHAAAALGVPTLALFGPTDENATRPLGPDTRLVVGTAECRPCLLRHCPIDHRCMTSIAVEEAFRTAHSLLLQRQRERLAWHANPA